MLRVLQVNLGRGKQAQDLLLETQRQRDIDISLISEFYRKDEINPWYQDVTGKAGILINKNCFIQDFCEGSEGFVWVEINNIRIYSCYFSPNDALDTFERNIGNLEDSITTAKGKIIVGGDFNAKSTQWQSPKSDRRGSLLTDMCSRKNLIVMNNDGAATFRRGCSSSIIDLTLASNRVASQIRNWAVLEEITLSDHMYIEFFIETNNKRSGEAGNKNNFSTPWNVKKYNERAMIAFLEERKILNEMRWTKKEETLKTHAKNVLQTIKEACNIAMPKRHSQLNRKPMYWWTEDISDLRKKCLNARRRYTRSKGCPSLKREYNQCKDKLKEAIKDSKRRRWLSLIEEVESDPWGKPFQLVTKKLGLKRQTPGLDDPTWILRIIRSLFPTERQTPEHTTKEADTEGNYPKFTVEELQKVGDSLKNNKAPGRDGIPNEAMKTIIKFYPELLLRMYNNCLENKVFFDHWKIQKLILIRKGNRPLNEPSSYRPICLLDTMGKILEGLIMERIQTQLESNRLLSDRQFGFRKRRSTVDAIKLVVETAEKTKEEKGFCALVSIDIKNAFNTAKWNDIISALEDKKTPGYILDLVRSYLSGRTVEYKSKEKTLTHKMTCGAPQGSKIGPLMWNVLYDSLLEIPLPTNVILVGFADDAIIVASANSTRVLEISVNDSLERVQAWLAEKGLEMAVGKTEAVLVTDRRSFIPPKFKIGRQNIPCQKSLHYLGMNIDNKLSFGPQVIAAAERAQETASALSRLMPNVRGPSECKRRMLMSVMHAKLLYAAPAWAEKVAKNKNLRTKLEAVQRKGALRITSAYRTVSKSAVLVLASVPPISLLALERKEVYDLMKGENSDAVKRAAIKKEARKKLMDRWQNSWQEEVTGRWTYKLMPNLSKWVLRKHGSVSYHLTQAFTGHGSFKSYLKRFGKADSADCDYCGYNNDDAEHTLFNCPTWANERTEVTTKLDSPLTTDNIITLMTKTQTNWELIERYITTIMTKKEEDQRANRRNSAN